MVWRPGYKPKSSTEKWDFPLQTIQRAWGTIMTMEPPHIHRTIQHDDRVGPEKLVQNQSQLPGAVTDIS